MNSVLIVFQVLIFFHSLYEANAGAIRTSQLVKEGHRLDRTYLVDYSMKNMRHPYAAESVVHWALKYIMRGSGILFSDRLDIGKRVTFYFNYFDTPIPTFTNEDGEVIIVDAVNISLRYILQDILRSLGVIYEYQREDRGEFLSLTPAAERMYPIVKNDVLLVTAYDPASIMHRCMDEKCASYQNGMRHISDDYKFAFSGKRSFLSSCDWFTLKYVYPDLKKREECVPGEILTIARPSSILIAYLNNNVDEADYICTYDNSGWVEDGSCRLDEGRIFPYIPNRREALILAADLLTDPEIAYFCSLYKSVDPAVESDRRCIVSCSKVCATQYGRISLSRCMKSKFPLCDVSVATLREYNFD